MGHAGKDFRLNVRMSADERDALQRRAELAGMTASEYVRRRSLADGDRPVVKVDDGEVRRLFVQLRRAGSNLNQCARELNTHHNPAVLGVTLDDAISSVAKASRDVSDFIADVRESI